MMLKEAGNVITEFSPVALSSMKLSAPDIPDLQRAGNYASTTLARLVAEWRAVRAKMGIPTSATVMDVAQKLGIDRGTAQRLNRVAKMIDVTPRDVGQFPGVRAWRQVLMGVERALGAEHANYQTLSLACDHFADWLRGVGGSRQAAARRAEASDRADLAGPVSDSPATARRRWVDAASESMGYSVDLRLDTQMARITPPGSPRRIDLATINALRGCRGSTGSMPIAFTRVAYAVDHTVIEGSRDRDPRSFHVLKSMTSKPAPAILTTGDAYRQTIFVEPQWSSLAAPLDVGILHEERGAFPSPFGTDAEWLEFSLVNRHPSRLLVIERVISREIDAMCTAGLRAYRSHAMLAHDEPWFDRIPEETPVTRVGVLSELLASPEYDRPFPGYSAMMSEAIDRTHWDPTDLIVFRAVIQNPVPLAMYTVMFDRVDASA